MYPSPFGATPKTASAPPAPAPVGRSTVAFVQLIPSCEYQADGRSWRSMPTVMNPFASPTASHRLLDSGLVPLTRVHCTPSDENHTGSIPSPPDVSPTAMNPVWFAATLRISAKDGIPSQVTTSPGE